VEQEEKGILKEILRRGCTRGRNEVCRVHVGCVLSLLSLKCEFGCDKCVSVEAHLLYAQGWNPKYNKHKMVLSVFMQVEVPTNLPMYALTIVILMRKISVPNPAENCVCSPFILAGHVRREVAMLCV